jgi:hypothetical protein
MESILKGVASVFIAYTAHYTSVKVYNYMCVPDGFMGYMTGIVSMGSPVCSMGVHIISSTQSFYSSVILMAMSRLVVDNIIPSKEA